MYMHTANPLLITIHNTFQLNIAFKTTINNNDIAIRFLFIADIKYHHFSCNKYAYTIFFVCFYWNTLLLLL